MTQPSTHTEPPLVDYRIEGGVAVLTLSNPTKRNALSREMLAALAQAVEEAATDDAVRALIIAHQGAVFSSGHNIRELVGVTQEDAAGMYRQSAVLMERIRTLPKPVIAQVEGLASAAGCQLVASCDLVVAAETSTFQTPGVMIGLFCSTPMVPLSRAVPPKKAMEMLLTGRPITARQAEQYGLVNRVVPAGQLGAEALALANDIIQYSAETIAMGKQAFYRQLPLPMDKAYEVARDTMTRNTLTEDAQEGMAAFLDKRPPKFKH